VVTLVREPEATCWGVAYELEPDGTEAILQALDHREKDGYERHRQNVRLTPERRGAFLGGGSNDGFHVELPNGEVEALLYVATPSNPAFLGEASIEDIAAQVRRARGPSGSNVEYVLELARALRAIGAHDEHVEALAEAVVEAVSS
jgi:cation transport regulator ChaC